MMPSAQGANGAGSWSVSALLLAVSDSLAARFGAVTVRGELSGFARAGSGHCYFSLKDASGAPGLVRCAMFRRAASLLAFSPADGQSVEVRGRLSVYEPRGELQLVVESLQRLGEGSLYEEFVRLKARLAAQGLFDPERRRPIARFPRVLAVITSPAAAALHDVLTTLQRRSPHVRILVYPSLVQGPQAPAALRAALAAAAADGQADTVLLVRGGGSLEDLWAFNDEALVRAVVASPIPVICGVGHETDVTLCDLAADLRAPTPTAAAELAAPATAELREQLGALAQRLARAASRRTEREAQRLDLLAHRAGRPAARLGIQHQRLDACAQGLKRALARRAERAAAVLGPLDRRLREAWVRGLDARHQAVRELTARLAAAHPHQVLERGFAWVTDAAGQPVARAAALAPGQAITAVFADGKARAEVLSVDPTPAAPRS